MQSQQKKVKWSRGETASALEERTDTGITEVSVARMENCMTDIYGNISRRPALKIMDIDMASVSTSYNPLIRQTGKTFTFYITEDDFILINVDYQAYIQCIRIKNKTVVYAAQDRTATNIPGIIVSATPDTTITFAQQNNYAIIATNGWSIKLTITLGQGNAFSINTEKWNFTAGWYAPNGTQTKAVYSATAVWNKNKLGFTSYIFTEKNGESTVWSYIDSGLTTPGQAREMEKQIPAGSIIQFPNNGAYMRFEGLTATDSTGAYQWVYKDKAFSGGLGWYDSVPSTGVYIKARTDFVSGKIQTTLSIYQNGTNISTGITNNPSIMVATNTEFIKWDWLTLDGSAPVWTTVSDPKIGIYGPLLTPAAASDKTDTRINVEYGYVNLTPETGQLLPTPSVVTFNDQRLWTAGWKIEETSDQYALVVGSQIAKYADFKNDYNLANEAITLDILTKHREEVLHLVDYNGLKIFTTGAEWAYVDGRPVKQSTNGSLRQCEPIVFGSLCLYADQTGSQIRAMQYELQSDIFNSSVINQMTPKDLIWNPICMAQYEDKVNNTGRHLFIINSDTDENPRVATSNFVPGNQATIWSRWNTQRVVEEGNALAQPYNKPLIHEIVDTKKYPIFMVCVDANKEAALWPAILDFESDADLLTQLDQSGTYYPCLFKTGSGLTLGVAYMPNVNVAVYSDGVYQYETTTDNTGTLVRQPTGLSNVTVGMPINARVVSHPIDVGGKTKTITKRIAKAVMSVRNTEPGAVTINNKTGYMNPAKDMINFYGVTGMKREIIYTITNNKGAKFTIESLTMNIEYGTLIS